MVCYHIVLKRENIELFSFELITKEKTRTHLTFSK